MYLKSLFQWIFIIESIVFCVSAFSVVGPLFNSDNNPEFSCAMIYKDSNSNITGLCSGEVVGKRWFLTAGHCIYNKSIPTVFCPHIQKEYPVTKVIIHPHYERHGTPYDQALLQVAQDFPFNPVHLPQSANEVSSLLKKECAIFGYGLDSAGKAGTLLGITAQFNGAFFGKNIVGLGSSAYPRSGDSGAGLLCREQKQGKWIRVGTISQAETGLANAALLSPSLPWIKKIVQNGFSESPIFTMQTEDNSTDSIEYQQLFCQPSPLLQSEYETCVKRLTGGAAYDDSGYLKNNLENLISGQCKKYLRKCIPMEDSLHKNDLKILFKQDPLRENNKIQSIGESYNVFPVRIDEDLCQRTADNLFTDGDSGVDRSTFFIKTKGGLLKFMVYFFGSRCELEFSYAYKSDCQSCGTRWWGQFNPIVSAQCDSIYVNQEGNLICNYEGEKHVVNMNYLRFLNKYSGCFRAYGYYESRFDGMVAEQVLHSCVYNQYDIAEDSRVSLCALNQLFFIRKSSPVFWAYDPGAWGRRHGDFSHHEHCPTEWFYQIKSAESLKRHSRR